MDSLIKVTWLSEGRRAQNKPDPAYPDGIDLDVGRRPACKVELEYPAPCVGKWLVECETCGCTLMVTAAGRPDDPRRVMVPCLVTP